MDLDQLRAFVTVSEELHFGRAALRLGCSQPQVSRRVRALEDELGLQLFVRTARRTVVTDAGARLLEDARDTLAAAERLERRASAAGRSAAGRVVVGFVWSTLGAHVAPLVGAAAERHPEIELTVGQLRFVEIVPALRRGDVDLAIVRALFEESEMIEVTLRHEPSVLAIPADHALASADKIALAQLDELPMVALQRDLAPTAYDAVTAAAAERGVRLRIVQQTRSPSEALALVSAGIGVYRLPSSAAVPQHGVVYREIEAAPSRLVLIRRPEPPAPAVAAIAALAHEVFNDADHASNDGVGALELRSATT
ncbi:MAG TPA: LysR substrate-binding domain-containing protein [Solirubrobacteraceae bacterium]|nr:LysR substrate-binding domain-containing protein [Solirubrobacteraceae bacterium]